MRKTVMTLALATALTACVTTPPINSWPAVTVTASGETVPVGTANDDAADDPAIWRNAENPAESLIVATDKKAGLYVYGLDGKARSFLDAGLLNNVDLADMGDAGIIVVASDRNDPANAALQVFRLNTAEAKLEPLGSVPGGTGEGYGLCLSKRADGLHAFSVLKDGTVEEYLLTLGDTLASTHLRTRNIATQTEGCVADPRDGTLYIGEENAGIWRYAADSVEGELVATIDNLQLVADVEGLAIYPEGEDGGYLVASSQGDNAYALYSLPGMEPAGRFRIAAGMYGATEETDGIELAQGSFGPDYPAGLFVAQDGINGDAAQNFKLVSWSKVEEAMKSWPPEQEQP